MLNKEKVYCGICDKEFKYTGTVGNLQTHLKNVHHITEETNKPQDSTPSTPQSSQARIDSVFKTSAQSSKYREDNTKQKRFRVLACQWIVRTLRPLNIMDDKSFKEMIYHADPRLTVPSSSTVTRTIKLMYNQKFNQTVEAFKGVTYFWVTTDAGTSFAGKTFIDVNVHWIDKDFKVQKKILTVLKIDSKTAKDYKDRVFEALEAHGIKEKCLGVTTDNKKTMEVSFNKEWRNGCFAHLDSKACHYTLESTDTLKKIRNKFKKVAKKANKSSKFKGAIEKEQSERGLKKRSLKQEVKTRFTATHSMIRSFMNDPNEKDTEKDIDEVKVFENLQAVNAALKSSFKKKEFEALEIEEDDMTKFLKVVPSLDMMEEAVTHLGGEKHVTASSVLPFLVTFNSDLQPDDNDTVFLAAFKETLKDDMLKRCSQHHNLKILIRCSYFNKCFSKLAFVSKMGFLSDYLEDDDVFHMDSILEEIKLELIAVQEMLNTAENDPTQEVTQEPAKKKTRFLAMAAQGGASGDGDDLSQRTKEVYDAENEMVRYSREPLLKFDDDVLLW